MLSLPTGRQKKPVNCYTAADISRLLCRIKWSIAVCSLSFLFFCSFFAQRQAPFAFSSALYFILDMRLILMMHAPGVYENGVYFFGTFYSWDKIRSYNIREAHRNIKFNVSNEQKKLFSTGDVVIIMDDVNQTQPVLKQHVSLKD